MSDNINKPLATDQYRDAFLPVYERVCGDAATYPDITDEFENHLTRTYYSYPERAAIKDLMASPQEAASIFEKWLAGGSQCPRQSTTGKTMSLARSFESAAHKITILEKDDTLIHIQDPKKLYDTWQQFAEFYMQSVDQLEEVVRNILNDGNMNFLSLNRLKTAVNRAALITTIWDSELKYGKVDFQELQVDEHGNTVAEANMVEAYNQRINNFRLFINLIKSELESDNSDSESLNEVLIDFIKVLIKLHDPFDWIGKVVLHYLPKIAPANLNVLRSPNKIFMRSYDTPALWKLFDLLSTMAINVADEGKPVNLEFKWDGFKKRFIVSLPVINGHELISAIDDLISRLRGSWTSDFSSKKADFYTSYITVELPMRIVSPPNNSGLRRNGSISIPNTPPVLPTSSLMPLGQATQTYAARLTAPLNRPFTPLGLQMLKGGNLLYMTP